MGIKQIKNETGTFYLDDFGRLICHEDLDRWSVRIPEGVTEIPDYALQFGIRELVLPVSLKRVGKYAFLSGDVDSVVFPSDPDPEMMVQLAHALRFAHTWNWDLDKDWPREYADIYRGKGEPRESWWRLSNDSGTFYVDSVGILMDFQPEKGNVGPAANGRTVLKHLHIPEGVTAIPCHMFRECMILREITFPKSLRYIGVVTGRERGNVFDCASLNDLVFPENLEFMGEYSFAGALIQSLTITGISTRFRMNNMRWFEDSHVGAIRVSMKYKKWVENWAGYECFELTHPELGQLYCIRNRGGKMIEGEEVVHFLYHLYERIAENNSTDD